jgi:hypothetical protein
MVGHRSFGAVRGRLSTESLSNATSTIRALVEAFKQHHQERLDDINVNALAEA